MLNIIFIGKKEYFFSTNSTKVSMTVPELKKHGTKSLISKIKTFVNNKNVAQRKI